MAANVYRKAEKESLWSRLSQRFNFSSWLSEQLGFQDQIPADLVKKCLFVFVLIMIYIFFQHNMDSLYRQISETETAIKERRASYISHKAAFRFKSRHSEISKSLENAGLHRNIEPPVKIETKED
ncbi:hypothetical protein LAG90_10810 [Marinilongibacter aquaticus]|uniref:FtsL-like putative cell division protein n=1 Tax=Marinilongibacter aquaticus TaxID=2975157 RepID=UPI0021BDE28F|nr:FtsL-like putative cell division protein [Marinilongibacter aquaticus]UBM57309.1 hypothetical protein LAG90_10810 [Marinilongibacter aquaticus]